MASAAAREACWKAWIGKQVSKESGKPFKSGEKLGTVTGMITHPITKRPAFTMQEDGTYVECCRCQLESDKPSWALAPPWVIGLAVKAFGDDIGSWSWRGFAEFREGEYLCNQVRPVEALDKANIEVIREVMRIVNDRFNLKANGELLSREKNRARAYEQTLRSTLSVVPAVLVRSIKGDDLVMIQERAERLGYYASIASTSRASSRSSTSCEC